MFIERKLHHESWVSNPSVKERFQLPGRLGRDFMDGKYSAEDLVNDFQRKILASEANKQMLSPRSGGEKTIDAERLASMYNLVKAVQTRMVVRVVLLFILYALK